MFLILIYVVTHKSYYFNTIKYFILRMFFYNIIYTFEFTAIYLFI